MEVVLRIEYRDILKKEETSYYNHLLWKIKENKIGFTHIREIYDDVSDYPEYELGVLEEGKFKYILGGQGDPIDKNYLGFGGKYLEITTRYAHELFHI